MEAESKPPGFLNTLRQTFTDDELMAMPPEVLRDVTLGNAYDVLAQSTPSRDQQINYKARAAAHYMVATAQAALSEEQT